MEACDPGLPQSTEAVELRTHSIMIEKVMVQTLRKIWQVNSKATILQEPDDRPPPDLVRSRLVHIPFNSPSSTLLCHQQLRHKKTGPTKTFNVHLAPYLAVVEACDHNCRPAACNWIQLQNKNWHQEETAASLHSTLGATSVEHSGISSVQVSFTRWCLGAVRSSTRQGLPQTSIFLPLPPSDLLKSFQSALDLIFQLSSPVSTHEVACLGSQFYQHPSPGIQTPLQLAHIMPLLKNNTDLAGATGHLSQWRFSRPPSKQTTFAKLDCGFRYEGPGDIPIQGLCTDQKRRIDENNHTIRPGMQGIVLSIRGVGVRVRFQNFHHEGRPLEAFLPSWRLRYGDTKYSGHWNINYKYEFVADRALESLPSLEGPFGLEAGIATFLDHCAKSESKWIPDDYHSLVKKYGIKGMTKILLGGLNKANVGNVLSKSGFTIEDLKKHTRKVNDWPGARNHFTYIIYYIWYEERDGTTHLYIGKSTDVDHRLYTYDRSSKEGSDNYFLYHTQLRLNAVNRHMGVLCHLETFDRYKEFAAIAEQLGVSFLETYRPGLSELAENVGSVEMMCEFGTSSGEVNGIAESPAFIKKRQRANDVEHHLTFKEIARETFAKTHYPGGISRKGFGVSQGVNWNSPLPEASSSTSFTPILYLKSESFILDDRLETYKVANYKRSKKQLAHWGETHTQNKYFHLVCQFYKGQDRKGTHSSLLSIFSQVQRNKKDDKSIIKDTEWPPEGTEVQTTFEVRKDWKAHPKGYARLPDVGPYPDWGRANGWAFRIDWKDSKNRPHFRYLQVANATDSHNKESKNQAGDFPGAIGALIAYDLGMAQSRFIFGDAIQNNGKPWMRECVGQMRVKSQDYDCINWSLSFREPERITDFPSGSYKGVNAVIAELKALKFNNQPLLTVDEQGTTTSLKRMDTKRKATRHKCDTCYMTNVGDCTKPAGEIFCYNNRKHGREVTTWSQGAPSAANHEATWGQLLQRKDLKGQAIRRALLDQMPEDPDARVGDDPNFQHLPSTLTGDEARRLYVLIDEEEDMELTGDP